MAIRKRESKMTTAEKNRFKNVITTLIENGAYGKMVSHHADMSHNMHGSMGAVGRQRFLPWHRDYLLKLEQAMQEIDPLSFIPYWRWTTQRTIPSWMVGFTPTVSVPGEGTIIVTRSPGLPATLPTSAQVNNIVNAQGINYTQFTSQLEGVHNMVHGWVGGTMNNIQFSPTDPIFWMHHAEIDRRWSIWQAKAANAGKNPSLTGSNRVLDPWTEIEEQVRSITAMGYSYGP